MKKKTKIILIAILLVFVSAGFLTLGFYFNRLSKASYRMGNVLDSIRKEIEPFFYIDSNYTLGDDFTLEGNLDIQQLKSDYYAKESLTNPDVLEKYKLIQNFSKLKGSILFQHSNKKKEAFIDLLGKLKDEQLMHSKLFVHDATEYYYIDGAVKNYVDTGNCGYFENYTKDITTIDQLDYLNDFFWESLKNNLKEEYFQKYKVEEKIEGKNKQVEQIMIRFTNKNIREILNHVIEDFKNDKRAYQYLKSIFTDFDSFKISDDVVFLDKEESYTLNIYSSTILYKPLKYELIYLNGDSKSVITYEGDMSSGVIYYTKDSQLVHQITCHFKDNIIQFQIQDIYGKDLGEFKIEKKNKLWTLHYIFQDGKKDQEIVFSSKYEHYKKNVSYDNIRSLSFNFTEDGVEHLNGEVLFTIKGSNKANIEEDVSGAMLESKLTDDEKTKVHEEWNRVWERMKK